MPRNGPGMSKTGPGLYFRVPLFEHNDFENQHELSIAASEMLVSAVYNHMVSFHIPSLCLPPVSNTTPALLLKHVDESQPKESAGVDIDPSVLFDPRHGADVHGRKRLGSESRHNIPNSARQPEVALRNRKYCEKGDQVGPLAGCDKNLPPSRQKIQTFGGSPPAQSGNCGSMLY